MNEESNGSCSQINVESQCQDARGSPSYVQDCMHRNEDHQKSFTYPNICKKIEKEWETTQHC
jgi:hypothetical protein